jgi:hypothetical protein
MIISVVDDKAQEFVNTSPLFKKLAKKKYIYSIVAYTNKKNDIRIFIREEVGKKQSVTWLSESDIEAWTDSSSQSYMHFSKKETPCT